MAASPVFVTEVEPLKTGKGILRLKLIPLLYPTGPSEIQIDLRVIHRREGYLVGVAKELAGAEHTLILEAISFEWLKQHCPSINSRIIFLYGYLQPETAQEGLNQRYGASQLEILCVASLSDVPTNKRLYPMPEKHTSHSMNREFSEYDSYLISRGVIPKDDDDKWFIYRQGNTLFFHRSWSGFCRYEVALQMRDKRIYFSYCKINRDPKQYNCKDDSFDVAMINWLVDNLLLRKETLMPESPDNDSELEEVTED